MEASPDEPMVNAEAYGCPSSNLLRKLWGHWKIHVLYFLGEEQSCRFGELKTMLGGVSPKVLTRRLRELEADGLVWREQENTIPPKVTYGLTETGRAIHDVLKGLDPIAQAVAEAEHATAQSK